MQTVPPPEAVDSGTRLMPGVVGLAGAATLGAVMMAPALGIYGNFGPMAAAAGKVAPVIFFIALVASLPTAISYALISGHMPSSGSAFTWLWRVTTPAVGLWVGIMMAVYYLVAVLLQPILFGLFFDDFLNYVGFHSTGYGTWLIGILIVTGIVAVLTYGGIKLSTGSALVLMAVESAVVLALTITIIAVKGGQGHLDWSPFNPGAALGGTNGLFAGLIFGLLSFTGYDVVSTVAEEADLPKRNIPKATLLACVGVGVFWIFASWGVSIAIPIQQVGKLVNFGVTPVTPIAHKYWGGGDILVILTGMSAATAVYVATVVGASRVMYAMGRDGSLPHFFGQLNPTYKTPWNAMHVVFALTIAIDLIYGAWVGLYNAFGWWGSAIVFFALITYMFVNLANIIYFRRFRPDEFNWFLNGLLPLAGIGIDIYLLYKSFFVSLWSAGFQMGQSIVLLSLAVLAAAVVYTLIMRVARPEVMARDVQVMEA